MKKFLMMGVLALTAMSWLASCADKDIEPYSAIDSRKQRFEEVFKQVFGDNIDPQQDWGFWNGQSESLARTRANVRTRYASPNGNEWANTYQVPSAITDAELQKVLAVFNQRGSEKYTSLIDWSTFFVQQVYKGTATYTDSAGNTGVLGSDKMNWLYAVNNGVSDHINNFNAGNNTTYDGIMLMESSSTRAFGFSNSNGQGRLFQNFRMEEIDGNYYVGFDFESWRSSEANGNEGVARDYIYNDWIVKIVKGVGKDGQTGTGTNPVTTVTNDTKTVEFLNEYGRVFCEDLGASSRDAENNRKDLDYNDVVFDVYNYYKHVYKKTMSITTTTLEDGTQKNDTTYTWEEIQGSPAKSRTYIVLQAAGGTIPLQVGGIEVHEKFNIGVATMVNTVKNEADVVGSYVTRDPVGFNTPTPYGTLDSIPIIVRYSDEVGEITAYEGTAPMKICVPIGTAWAAERHGIGDAYPVFRQYVSNHTINPWESSDADHIYDGVTSNFVPSYDLIGDEVVLDHSVTVSEVQTLNIHRENFSVSDKGAIVYVYGEALNGSELKAFVGDEEIQGSYARTRAAVQTRSFTLNSAQAEEAKAKGVTIKGKYFTIHKASVVEYEPDVPTRQGDIIWEGEKQLSSTDGISLSNSSFVGAGKKTKIRVYGIGKSKSESVWQVILSKSVNGAYSNITGTSAKSDRSGAYELTWEMTADGAADLLSNGLTVRGQNFKVKYVTIDNSQVEPELPEVRGYQIWPASGEGNKTLNWTALDLDKSKFVGAGIGSVLRVYGVGKEAGADSWQVSWRKKDSDWTNIGLADYTYWNKGSQAGAFELEWTLTSDVKDAVKYMLENGVRLTGMNFVVKYITIDNTNSQPIGGETPSGSGVVVWEYEKDAIYYNDYYIDWGKLHSDKFSSAHSDKTMRIYCTFKSSYFQFKLRLDNDYKQFPEDALSSDSNWSFDDNRKWIVAKDPDAKNVTKGCIELKLNSSLVSAFQNHETYLWVDQLNISKITIE